MRERDIERYLVKRVKELGGEVRKVQWVGRNGAPDRVVMLPAGLNDTGLFSPARTVWVELKAPGKLVTFPADARERAQAREHKRMRAMGQRVKVVDCIERVDEVLA